MKHIFIVLSSLLTLFTVQAQTTFSYQAAVRTASGLPMANKNLIVRVSIKDSAINGALLYRETHNRTTNALGLLEIEVGGGLVQTGTFTSINWGRNAKYLQTEVDTGNGNYLDLGTTQLLSVPTALYAREAGNGVPTGGGEGQVLTRCNGQLVWTNGGQCPGSVASLDCTNPTHTGVLTSGTAASAVTTAITYTGGNGGTYNSQTINSMGVTGLTATLTAGTLATGNGTLTFAITGTPASSGTASFALSIGGQSCTFTRTVAAPQPAYPTGTVHCNGTPTAVVEVTNPVTGRIWMDRNLGASRAAISSTDTAAYGDLYQWGRRADGHQCRTSSTTSTLSSTDQPSHGNFILAPSSPSDWRSPQNNNLWQGANGVNNPCPIGFRLPTDAEFNTEKGNWNTNNSSGAFNSVLKLVVGGWRNGANGLITNRGIDGVYWTSSVNGTNSRRFHLYNLDANLDVESRVLGFAIRCIKDASSGGVGSINTLDCANPTHSGTLTSGTAASGATTAIAYTGGNGGTYTAQTITSTGVTGLTATLIAGTLATGNGTLTFTITGTPASSGTASFALSIGGQSCTFTRTVTAASTPTYPAGTVHCSGTPTAVVEVTNPVTGRIWMDRNLGASRAATSSTDAAAYGDLYQWGRRADGHQCRTSGTTTTLSSTDQPSHGNFIFPQNSPWDWRSPQSNLWQGVNGVNNPCPTGFRLPTETEINSERTNWSENTSIGAFASPLKLPMPGARSFFSGSLSDLGIGGKYWSSTVFSTLARYLRFSSSSDSSMDSFNRAAGFSIRCIKD